MGGVGSSSYATLIITCTSLGPLSQTILTVKLANIFQEISLFTIGLDL
jgi:hypothetical protein